MTDDTHKTRRRTLLDRYLSTYGRYPRFRRKGLTVEMAPGYIVIRKRLGVTYVSKRDLIPLLRWLVPLVKEMGPSFDPDVAMSAYLEDEAEYDRAQRLEKKARP